MYEEMVLNGYNKLKTQEKLYVDFKNYFSKKEKIKSIEKQIETLENSNRELQYSIQHTTFEIDNTLPTGGYDERTSGGNTAESYIEKKFVVEIDRLERLIEKNNKKIFELVNCKNLLFLEITDMNIFIDMMSESYKDIFHKRFVEGKTLLEIGIDINASEGTIRKNIKKIEKSYDEFKKSLYAK